MHNCTLIFTGSPRMSYTNLAVVPCAILNELKILKNLKWQIILHIFTKNLYPQKKCFS